MDLDGIPVTLFDTAGLREAPDPVEAEGVRRSRLVAEGADLVLYLVDGTAGAAPEDLELLGSLPEAVRVWNKVDRADALAAPEGWITLSAVTGEGFPALAAALGARLRGEASSGNLDEARGASLPQAAERLARIANRRQAECARRAVRALRAGRDALAAGVPLDAAAVDLREAADALAELTGESVPEAVLETIFSRFCVGK